MKVVIQRVKYACVEVDNQPVSEIESGLLIFLGVCSSDAEKEADYLVDKVINLRIFEDENGKMNLSVCDLNKQIMVISQFTLYGDCRKGRRPSFTEAMNPQDANRLYEYFIDRINLSGFDTKKGVFGAKMSISLLNDGPVTFIIDSI